MGENKDYMTHPEDLGCIHISEDVLATIAGGAAMEVEGIGGMMSLATKKSSARGVRIAVDEEGGMSLFGDVRASHWAAEYVRVAVEQGWFQGYRDEEGAVVDLYVMIRYGYPIPEVAEKIQSAVSTAIESMTGFTAKAVNVHVGGVSFQ